jgi:predicted nucleic acid-binding protein
VRFVDTNVLIYAVSPSPQEADKRRRAQELLEHDDLTLSVQVLQEFFHQVTRPNRTDPLTDTQALGFLESIDSFPVQPVTLELFHSAVSISRRFQLSHWDGAILAAARAAGCDAVYSEDLNSEQNYDGLRVIDPF